MELFTIGRGNYTENDIKEGARAFTGWGFNLQGEFVTGLFFTTLAIKRSWEKPAILTEMISSIFYWSKNKPRNTSPKSYTNIL